MDPDAGSCGYIAPLVHTAIRCFEPIEYRYVLAAGRLEDIRAEFARRSEDVANPFFEALNQAAR